MSKVAQKIIKTTMLSRNMVDPGETYLCTFLRKVTDYTGGGSKAVYEHLQPTIHLLGTTGDVIAASTAVRMGIPQAIGKLSEFVAPVNNSVFDSVTSAAQYVTGVALTGIGKLMTGKSDIGSLLQEGLSTAQSDAYSKIASLTGKGAAKAAEAVQSAGITSGTSFYEQAYSGVVDNLTAVQQNATSLLQGAVDVKEQASKVIFDNITAVHRNAGALVQGAVDAKDQVSRAIFDNLATMQKSANELMKEGSAIKDQAYDAISKAAPVIKENASVLRNRAIEFAQQNQTAITVVAGVAAIAAVGYVGYTMYSSSKAEEKTTNDPKEMKAKLNEEFSQIKASRETALNEEKAKLGSKFQELKSYLKDSKDFKLQVLDSFCEEMVSQYNKDQTINPNDIKRIEGLVKDGLVGSGLEPQDIENIKKSSVELIASVMMCDQLRQDLSKTKVTPSFVEKEVAKRAGMSQGRNKVE